MIRDARLKRKEHCKDTAQAVTFFCHGGDLKKKAKAEREQPAKEGYKKTEL